MANMLNINMISVTNGALHAASELGPKKRSRAKTAAAKRKPQQKEFEETLYAISIDWAHLRNSSRHCILSSFVQAIKYCKEHKKEEFVVQNIVPWVSVGRDDPSIVVSTQDEIVGILFEAIAWVRRDIPEFRLTLRHGEYDIRFYLGNEQPTDCLHFDDRE